MTPQDTLDADTAVAARPVVSAAGSSSTREFLHDMQQALGTQPRAISPKYFYDAAGSRLFDRICELPEYYPTRTEFGILTRHLDEIAAKIGPDVEILEFGAGSLHKVRLLLDVLERPVRYMPIDISQDHLADCARDLRAAYPQLDVLPVVADYTKGVVLPPQHPRAARRMGFCPGSALSNFTPEEGEFFLRVMAGELRGGSLLLGVDLVKSPDVLHAAYNDAQGVTAQFNLNVLVRANRELGANFVLDQFAHSAFYNAPLRRIEMHLVSRCRQQVTLAGQTYAFEEGDTLHTENSYKFTVDSLRALAARAGFTPGPMWMDPQRQFLVHWLHAPQ